jgi:hypothetical protein
MNEKIQSNTEESDHSLLEDIFLFDNILGLNKRNENPRPEQLAYRPRIEGGISLLQRRSANLCTRTYL